MRNIVKKVAAFALAFTLLGTGTAVTKTISPDFNTAITASAACYHNYGQPWVSYGEWRKTGYERDITYFQRNTTYNKGLVIGHEVQWTRLNWYHCSSCGQQLYFIREYKWVQEWYC